MLFDHLFLSHMRALFIAVSPISAQPVFSLLQTIIHKLKGQCRHDQSRLSTGHGIGVLV